MPAPTVIVLDLTAFSLASILTVISYMGYRSSQEVSYLYGCAGFGLLGLSAVITDVTAFVSSDTVGEHIQSVSMILGLGLVVYGGEMAE